MNPPSTTYNWGTNIGGWKDSNLRTYLNTVTYNSLLEDLRKGVAKTKVVFGYGHNGTDTANFVTDDYFYLLFTKGVWGSITNYSSAIKKIMEVMIFGGYVRLVLPIPKTSLASTTLVTRPVSFRASLTESLQLSELHKLIKLLTIKNTLVFFLYVLGFNCGKINVRRIW